MRFSFAVLSRLCALVFLVTTLVAIGIGRMLPPDSDVQGRLRVRQSEIRGYTLPPVVKQPLFPDPETGRAQILRLPQGDLLDQASCSPWRDDRGRGQVVGRWLGYTGRGKRLEVQQIGLARYEFPSGKALDRIPSEIIPSGPPCWFPDTTARVLFAGIDGRLYRFAFEGGSSPGGDWGGADRPWSRPRPVSWAAGRPGDGPVQMRDVTWPAAPQFGGRVLVSLFGRTRGEAGSGTRRIWWLALRPDATAVEAAARLTVPDPGDPDGDRTEERFPSLLTAPDGTVRLAFLAHRPGYEGQRWDLRVAPVEIDRRTGVPSAPLARSRVLAEACLAMPPDVSKDGRWITFVTQPGGPAPQVRRIAVGAPGEPPTPSALASAAARVSAVH